MHIGVPVMAKGTNIAVGSLLIRKRVLAIAAIVLMDELSISSQMMIYACSQQFLGNLKLLRKSSNNALVLNARTKGCLTTMI